MFIFQRKTKKRADLKVAACRLPSVARLYKRIPRMIYSGRGGAFFAKQICHGAKRSLLASSRQQTLFRSQTTNMSFWAKGGTSADRSRTFAGWAKRTSKSARRSRSRIWFKILVACHGNVTSIQKLPKLRAISLRRCRSSVLPRSSLGKTSTSGFALRSEWHIEILFAIIFCSQISSTSRKQTGIVYKGGQFVNCPFGEC